MEEYSGCFGSSPALCIPEMSLWMWTVHPTMTAAIATCKLLVLPWLSSGGGQAHHAWLNTLGWLLTAYMLLQTQMEQNPSSSWSFDYGFVLYDAWQQSLWILNCRGLGLKEISPDELKAFDEVRRHKYNLPIFCRGSSACNNEKELTVQPWKDCWHDLLWWMRPGVTRHYIAVIILGCMKQTTWGLPSASSQATIRYHRNSRKYNL